MVFLNNRPVWLEYTPTVPKVNQERARLVMELSWKAEEEVQRAVSRLAPGSGGHGPAREGRAWMEGATLSVVQSRKEGEEGPVVCRDGQDAAGGA